MKSRLALTLLAFVAMLVTMFGFIPLVLTIASLSLVVVWIGIPMLLVSISLLRAFVSPWRAWAGWVRDREVIRPYRTFPRGGWFARLRWIVTDQATWRDLLWVVVNAVAGFTLALLPVVFLLGATFYLIYPLLLAVTPPGVFDNPMGLFVLRSWWEGLFMWPVAAVLFGLWWAWTPGLLRAWSAVQAGLLGPTKTAVLMGRVDVLAASRADTVDTAAREVRRIERDLHDGAQVRLVSLAMSLGLAEELIDTDPERAKALIIEATAAAAGTLHELRTLVRGIHPPVLADRGLVGAVQALALDSPLPAHVEVTGFEELPDVAGHHPVRLDAPVEACAYFAVAEAMANAIKHAEADTLTIRIDLQPHHLVVTVHDDGHGGARLDQAGGLAGIQRRLAAFDGTLDVVSPTGGPTRLTMDLPCEPLAATVPTSAVRA